MGIIVRMLRLLSVGAFVAAAAIPASAEIKVTISDGGAPKGPASFGGFQLHAATGPGDNTPLVLLTCAGDRRPCTVYFPSGSETRDEKNDTLAFTDNCGGDLTACTADTIAQVVKTESTTGRVELKGLQITALTGRKVEMVFSTDAGDHGPIPAGTHPVAVMLIGGFTTEPPTPVPGTIAVACPDPAWETVPDHKLLAPCAHLKLQIRASSQLNKDGDPRIASVSIPCDHLNASAINPCALETSGHYDTTGEFKTVDYVDYTCEGCQPYHVATLTALFTAEKETLALGSSGVTAMSSFTEVEFGREDLAYTVSDEYESPFWVSYTAANEPYRAATRASVAGDKVSLTVSLAQARRVRAKEGVTLSSIATTKDGKNGDNYLPLGERIRNDRSYASFIAQPKTVRWGDVAKLQLNYQVVTDTSDQDDPRLGKLKLSDCADSSFYVRVALSNEDGSDAGVLIINLGSANQFTSGCAAAKLSDLMDNTDARVDASRLAVKPACLITVKESKEVYGKLFVRSISVVVDQGIHPKHTANYQVRLYDAIVRLGSSEKEFKATDFLAVVANSTFKPVARPPGKGRSIVISELTGRLAIPRVVLDDKHIVNYKDTYVAKVPTKRLKSNTTYRVDVCLYGGRCVPTDGVIRLNPAKAR